MVPTKNSVATGFVIFHMVLLFGIDVKVFLSVNVQFLHPYVLSNDLSYRIYY